MKKHIHKVLNELYSKYEDQLGEHDITKDEFMERQLVLQEVGEEFGFNVFANEEDIYD